MGHEKIKGLFFENPSQEFYLRQIAKLTKIPKTSAARELEKLQKSGLVLRKRSKPFDRYIANTENPMYRFYKKNFIIEKIQLSGLVDYVVKESHPKAIVLFGSCAKGEYTSNSDIDLFVISPEAALDLEKFKLKHKINLFFEPDILKISKELRQNVINGVILFGMIKI